MDAVIDGSRLTLRDVMMLVQSAISALRMKTGKLTLNSRRTG
jgi:hypothetical protein